MSRKSLIVVVFHGLLTWAVLGQGQPSIELIPSFLERDFDKEEAAFNQSLPEGAVVVTEESRKAAREAERRRRPRRSQYAFSLTNNDRVVFLGDALLEREQLFGHLETRLTVRYPRKKLRFRNLSWSGDTPTGISRASFDWHKKESSWFERIQQPLVAFKPTVIVLGYGMSSSFDGMEGLEKFRSDLNGLIDRISEVMGGEAR